MRTNDKERQVAAVSGRHHARSVSSLLMIRKLCVVSSCVSCHISGWNSASCSRSRTHATQSGCTLFSRLLTALASGIATDQKPYGPRSPFKLIDQRHERTLQVFWYSHCAATAPCTHWPRNGADEFRSIRSNQDQEEDPEHGGLEVL